MPLLYSLVKRDRLLLSQIKIDLLSPIRSIYQSAFELIAQHVVIITCNGTDDHILEFWSHAGSN